MPLRVDPSVVNPHTRPGANPGVRPAPAPAAPARPSRPATGPSTPQRTGFDTTRPRPDGSLMLGRREGGPGEISLSKTGELLLNGKAGVGARIETARLIETGFSPFAHASNAQRTALAKELAGTLTATDAKKPTTQGPLFARSAAATLLLSLARTAPEKGTREATLNTYIKAMATEPSLPLRKSMLVNLDFTRLEIPASAAARLATVRAEVLPPRPPYDEWFKGPGKPKLEVRHYVMDEFWREEVSNWKKRGLEVVKDSGGTLELRGTIADSTGKNPPLPVHVVLKKEDENVLRDMNDPEANLILYSGHSQLGGVIDGALATAPKTMNGTKLVELFNCRGKQSQGDFLAKYPGVHLTSTFSSAYGSDDKQVLDATMLSIAARADYSDIKKRVVGSNLIQPESNYMLPDDKRNLATRDDDRDGVADMSAIGPDRFFDPGRLATRGGAHVFSPAALDDDPQELSGAKLTHAIGYANTSFFYFAEANHSAPLTVGKSDKMLPGGWFVGPPEEKVRITEVKKDGQTFHTVSVNSRFSSRSREVITSTVLMEMQKHLAVKDHGKVTEKDMLSGLILVGGYLDLFCPYSDTIDEVLGGFSKTYGFSGVSYQTYYEAAKKDGHDGTASAAALAYLKQHGVSVRAPG